MLEFKESLNDLIKIFPVDKLDVLKEKMYSLNNDKNDIIKDIFKNNPMKLNINNSDPLGPFIECDINKDNNSYRSPWSNKYYPEIESNIILPNELRELEEKLNTFIKLYTKIYYGESAISSVYIKIQDNSISNGFYCYTLIKNNILNSNKLNDNTYLDTIHITSIKYMRENNNTDKEQIKVIYKTKSNYIYNINLKNNCEYNGINKIECTKTSYVDNYFDYNTHINLIGSSIEENEELLRYQIDGYSLEKNISICNDIRNLYGLNKEQENQVNNVKSLFIEYSKNVSDIKNSTNNY